MAEGLALPAVRGGVLLARVAAAAGTVTFWAPGRYDAT
jgi:hypothetical protein